MTADACIVIVNWNGRRLLETCLPAVAAQTYASFEVVVMDNGSTDGSAEWLGEHFPQVGLIRNESNIGFCAANNQAFAATPAPYLAALNNDAAPDPQWLAELVRAMESDPRVGMCASKILCWDRRNIIDSAGIAPDRSGTFWQLRAGEPDDPGESPVPREVFGPSGAAALYRRAMLDQVGGFDEDFFAYLEDADLAWRARMAGWKCLYVPTARVYHRHSATGGEGSPFKGYHLGRNKWWTIAKNYPWPELLWNLPIIVGCDLTAVAYHLLVRRDISPLRGRWTALRTLGLALRKRRHVQEVATLSGREAAWRLRHPLRWRPYRG